MPLQELAGRSLSPASGRQIPAEEPERCLYIVQIALALASIAEKIGKGAEKWAKKQGKRGFTLALPTGRAFY
ncbi:MAG: hypothetical protein GVY28_00945 [Alphaproteobacteria bacterium]|jgi:hypothetical protein|nr:hypothetical protein [Alphaproteobacteria bacterium]